jgi:hypothetical protein
MKIVTIFDKKQPSILLVFENLSLCYIDIKFITLL